MFSFPGPLPREAAKAAAFRRLEVAARIHHRAVSHSVEMHQLGQANIVIIDAVLRAGETLDREIQFAFSHGATAAEIAATAELHPRYIAELLEP